MHVKIEREVGRALTERGWTLAVAESCTGGLIGHRLTSISGCSKYFLGGIIAYANEVKTRELGIPAGLLRRSGAVSAVVAYGMAVGVRRKFGSDVGLGVTGIAGPEGGTRKKPVGLVYIGVSCERCTVVRRFKFSGARSRIKTLSSEAALKMLRECFGEKGERHG